MKMIARTIVQFVIIGCVALLIAFTANAIRADGSLQLTKNYFDTGASRLPIRTDIDSTRAQTGEKGSSAQQADPANLRESDAHSPATRGIAQDATQGKEMVELPTDAATLDSKSSAASGEAHLDHPYKTIAFEDLAALVDDPMTEAGLNVLIDARNEERFAEGHLPGAMLCNPYNAGRYIDRKINGLTMIDHVLNAEKVVVYCGGGACEDSIWMARELLELDVPYDAIYIYEGGWKDWTTRGGRIEKGSK
jgi:rhodanese-related sulfurtransferase